MSTSEGFAHPEFLIETEALERQLGSPDLRILDCTTHLIPDPNITYQVVPGRADFEKGHIPGAQFVDLQGDLSDKNHRFRFMLPSAEAFAAAMSGFGVGEGTRVVLYSTANPWWATRVWWMLRVFGFDNAAVLNGGWQKWSREGRPAETGPAKSRASGHFVVREQRPLMVGELRKRFAAIGAFDKNVITYCGGGIAASADALALVVFVSGSITDVELVERLFSQSRFDYVYHIAAYAAEGLSHFIRRFNYTNNLIGSTKLINAAIRHECKCFVFTSSIAVYGAGQVPMR